LDKYFASYSDAKIFDIKKIKSLIETIKNFSNNIIKSMNAVKKTNHTYTPEDLYFSAQVYKEKNHDEIIAVNVYVFLVGSGCVETNPAAGSLLVEHKFPVIKQFQDSLSPPQSQSFLTSAKLQFQVGL
jgi:hypothetical protein